MQNHGKKYNEVAQMVERGKAYPPKDAVDLVKKTSYTKFDATVELHLRLGVDPRKADQMVRGVALLPHGLGKSVRVLVFAQGEAARIGEEAGADFVGSDDLVKKIEDGWFDFDVAIATPDMMGKVGKLGRLLGRRGLMPNPKSGTIANPGDLARVIRDARKGRVEFRLDKTGLIHVPIGKVSFPEDKLVENLAALIDAVVKAKPSGAKGQYMKNATLASTMGPGVKLDLQPTLQLAAAA
ncbi:MAG: 50S ribosomal protein L1 [Chloroflexi bacterium]|nr:50S ribosomal protein L1 [Chloroflexota bacterium]